jgi:hypothetical protein
VSWFFYFVYLSPILMLLLEWWVCGLVVLLLVLRRVWLFWAAEMGWDFRVLPHCLHIHACRF